MAGTGAESSDAAREESRPARPRPRLRMARASRILLPMGARDHSARVAGLVLAAGSGRRFGSPKQLATLEGRPLLEHALLAMAAATGVVEEPEPLAPRPMLVLLLVHVYVVVAPVTLEENVIVVVFVLLATVCDIGLADPTGATAPVTLTFCVVAPLLTFVMLPLIVPAAADALIRA